jgi:ATP-dependent helicase/nuclease subunit A
MSDPADRDSVAADALARERASDPRLSVLLQAPAGSGKTTVLTERLLRLLAVVDEPEEILAITFTRKAAAEMRARVLKALRKETDTSNEQGKRMRALADAALARAAARAWDLAQDPGRLRIQTIDSFNFRLASQLTVTAKAGGALVITERAEEIYIRAARQTLASADDDPQLGADIELLFERLDNNWGNVESLLARMLEQRGHWLRYVLAHGPTGLCTRVNQSLREIVRDNISAIHRVMPAALRIEAAGVPSVGVLSADPSSVAAWQHLAELTLTKDGQWRRSITKTLGREFENPAARGALKDLIDHLNGVGGLRGLLEEVGKLPPATLSVADAGAIEALSRVLHVAAVHLQAEFALMGRVDHTYVAGAARAALSDTGLPTDFALRTGLSLRHILVDEFQDTSIAQFELIEALTVGWEAGDGRTLFVVGDPMQSIYQFREAEVGLFLRARDRGIGNVRLEPLRLTRNFRSIPQVIEWINDAFTTLFPAEDDLRASAVSFTRSLAGRTRAPEVVTSPPAREPLVSRAEGRPVQGSLFDDPTPISASATPTPQPPPPPPTVIAPVRVRLYPDADRTVETTAIVERITEIKARDPGASIAVLVASRSHAAPIITLLEARCVEAIGVDLVPLRELSIIQDLVALLQATSHLGFRTAWLALLRAPWCGASLPALTAVSERRDKLLVWEVLWDTERLSRCPPGDQARLIRVRDVLETAMESRNNRPLADWLELTWLRLGAADAYPVRELRNARAFFTALSERVASGEWSGVQDLGSLLSGLFAETQAIEANPVQLMTIHRAKGLEFDHVFIPSLDRDLNRGREPLLRWLDLPRSTGEQESDLIMAPVPAIGEDEGGEVSRYLKRLMGRRAANEQVRLLYVAATRAKQTLEFSATPKLKADGSLGPRSGTLLACLWPAIEPMAAEAVVPAGAGPNATAGGSPGTTAPPSADPNIRLPPQRLHRLITTWAPPVLPTPPQLPRLPISHQSLEPPEFSWVGETARHIGTVVHAALEHFASLSQLPAASNIEASRDLYAYQLRRHGVPEPDLQRAAATVVEALSQTVTNERGRWIFNATHREARSEWALTGIAAGRLTNVVIDRSFVDTDGTRWVIDFKTSRHEGGGLEAFLDQEVTRYRAQLETYVALAEAMGAEPVRAGLYFPLLGVFREITET